MFSKNKKIGKCDIGMMCVYAGPDSLYWKTGNISDANKTFDPSNEEKSEEMKKVCPKCGYLNQMTNRFCIDCGAKLFYPDGDRQV